MAVIDKLRSFMKSKEEKNVALLVDGPNVIRKDVNIDLEGVKKKVEKYGKIRICKVFLDQYASDKLIEAVINQGYEPVITTGDVDVTMAVYAVEQIFNPRIQILALMTRDIDFRPVIVKAKEKGKETIVIGADPGFSVALKKTADIVIFADAR
ncbi:TIGR00288 family NYN domain-containing protein [Candidatus Micrarchaeota archaeon]|nr:TIGR00288 family NYN domain-containing protein [Candidatus Micrarchaeota archaeon]